MPVPLQPLRRSQKKKLERFTLKPIECAVTGFAQGGTHRHLSIVASENFSLQVGQALGGLLKSHGISSNVVTLCPDDPTGVVFLGLRSDKDVRDVYKKAFSAAQKFARSKHRAGGLFITVQDTGGVFGLSDVSHHQAQSGGLAGLCKTAALEWQDANTKAIDIDSQDEDVAQVAQRLADEICFGGPVQEVGLLKDKTRVTLCSVPEDLQKGKSKIDINSSSVILVSGGGRGVTAATALRLAEKTKARFVLLGRTKLFDESPEIVKCDTEAELKKALLLIAEKTGEALTPKDLTQKVSAILANREIRMTLKNFEKAGSAAEYLAVNVEDAGALAHALLPVRNKWGGFSGIIHGAGVLADKLIAEKTEEQFLRVFDTKILGLNSLLKVTENDNINLICLFSSVAARGGNLGQCDYAAANEILNKVAQAESKRLKNSVVKSFGWGPWEGGMVTPQLKKHFESMGVTLIPLDAGAELFVDEILSGDSEVELVLGCAPRLSQTEKKTQTLEIAVDKQKFGFLASHVVKGVPVVPAALVLEWFSRAARLMFPHLQLGGVTQFKVMRGIALKNFETSSETFLVRCTVENQPTELRVELLSTDNLLRYSAKVQMLSVANTASQAVPTLDLTSWGSEKVYGNVLFHGPDFQVIKKLDGVSENGASATLGGVHQMNWQSQNWSTDVAAFDGGLQLALLWTQKMLGGASLPTSIEEIQTYSKKPVSGAVRCLLSGRSASKGKALSDIVFLDALDNSVLARFKGVETFLIPNQSEKTV